MTEKGFIICRPVEGISLNGLEYLFDDRNEIWHFDTKEDVWQLLEEHDIADDEDIIIQYHVFCQQCSKEFFFEADSVPEETTDGLYVCPDCKPKIEKLLKLNQ
jgi:DNA-directed RNA polymerase subunit RPC12/RpoP